MANMDIKESSMKDTWIPHHGGPCPVPWAREGELDVKFRYGRGRGGKRADQWFWEHYGSDADIIAYRLTDDWVPVKGDGTVPKEIEGRKGGEWEYRLEDGEKKVANYSPNSYVLNYERIKPDRIVAVRYIGSPTKKEEVRMNAIEATKTPFKSFRTGVIGEPRKGITERVLEEIMAEYSFRELHISIPLKDLLNETMAGSNVKKAASLVAQARFRNSKRGKEALAMLGKVDEPTPRIGEDAMLRIFNEALDIFEAELERKRNDSR